MLAVNNPFESWQPPTREEMRRIAREESEATLEELAQYVRRDAGQHPDWQRYAGKLGVYADEGETYLGLQPGDEDEAEAFELEYGNEKQPPSAFLRNTLSAHNDRLGEDLGHRVINRVVWS
jgi:hypothetical protein